MLSPLLAIRPMFSSAGLRTSRPSTPCASPAPMMVTDGGGTASFDAAAGAGGRAGGGEPLSSCAQDVTATNVTSAMAMNMTRGFVRIQPPEVLDRWVRID